MTSKMRRCCVILTALVMASGSARVLASVRHARVSPNTACQPFRSWDTWARTSLFYFNNDNAAQYVTCEISLATAGTATSRVLSAAIQVWDRSTDTSGWEGAPTSGDLYCDVWVKSLTGLQDSAYSRKFACSVEGGCTSSTNGKFLSTLKWTNIDIRSPGSIIFGCMVPGRFPAYGDTSSIRFVEVQYEVGE